MSENNNIIKSALFKLASALSYTVSKVIFKKSPLGAYVPFKNTDKVFLPYLLEGFTATIYNALTKPYAQKIMKWVYDYTPVKTYGDSLDKSVSKYININIKEDTNYLEVNELPEFISNKTLPVFAISFIKGVADIGIDSYSVDASTPYSISLLGGDFNTPLNHKMLTMSAVGIVTSFVVNKLDLPNVLDIYHSQENMDESVCVIEENPFEIKNEIMCDYQQVDDGLEELNDNIDN